MIRTVPRRFLAALLAFLSLAMLAAPRGHAAENAVVEARMLDDLKYLAGEECEGRGLNTEGLNKAAAYIARQFKEAGLKPITADGSYYQPFDITSGTKLIGDGEKNRVTLKGPLGQTLNLDLGKQFTVMGFSGTGKVSAPVVFVGYGTTAPEHKYDDFAGVDVAGKVVVVLRQIPQQGKSMTGLFPGTDGGISKHARLDAKASNAEVHKAAAIIYVNDNQTAAETRDQLRDFASTSASFDPVSIPSVHLRRPIVNAMVRGTTGKDLSEIEKAIDDDVKPRSVALDGWTCEIETNVERTKIPVKNVIGIAEGSGPLANETIVIGGHYDHLGRGERGSLQPGSKDVHYGADDNASGTATVLEVARRFGAMKDRKGRRIVFICFTGEEKGLLGSAYYCKKPLFPLETTAVMINLDMVGRLREDKIQVFGTGTAAEFGALLEKLNANARFSMKQNAGTLMFGGSSDHESFNRKNVPTIFFFTGNHPQYHRPTDKVDLLNVEGMRRIAEMVENIALEVSSQEKRPVYVNANAKSSTASSAQTPRVSGPRMGVMPAYGEEDKEGMLLEGVTPKGPAEKAGLKGGDRIVELAGKPVKNLQNYMTIMSTVKKGEKIPVTVVRDGKQVKLEVTPE